MTIDGHRRPGGPGVSEVLKGSAGTTVVRFPVAFDAPRSSSDIRYKRGDGGICCYARTRALPALMQRIIRNACFGPPARIDALRRSIGKPPWHPSRVRIRTRPLAL